MKPIDEEFRFDKLVDGELSETERRELLSGLDDAPGGWRRCALAFLEAQALKQDLGAILQEPAQRPTVVRRVSKRWLAGHRGTILAMAGSFLVALYLGSMLRPLWQEPPVAPAPNELAGTSPQLPEPTEAAPSQEIPEEVWWMVTLTGGEGPDGQLQSIQLPAVERNELDRRWLENLPQAIPEDVLQALQRTGHRVDLRRRLLPVRLKDGRRAVFPVDQVDVHYVGQPAL